MSSIKELTCKVEESQATVFSLAKDLEGGGNKITVERRTLLPEAPRRPDKQESPPRAHTFHDLEGFKAYLVKYGGPNVVIFCDVPASKVFAILDEKATHGRETVLLAPQLHPRWAPWEALIGQQVDLASFVDFVRTHRRAIVEPDGRSLALALSQVKASTSIELHKGKGKKSLNGLLVKTEIQGTRDEELVELPEELAIRSPIFVAGDEQTMKLDLIIEATDGEIAAQLSAADLIEAKITAFDAMLAKLADLREKMTVTYGRPAEGSWVYLR